MRRLQSKLLLLFELNQQPVCPFLPLSTVLLNAQLLGVAPTFLVSPLSAVSTKLSYKTNVSVLILFSVKLQLTVLMPHFLPMSSLFKADVIDFIPYY